MRLATPAGTDSCEVPARRCRRVGSAAGSREWRPRTTPSAVLGDKAYSSRRHRKMLRDPGVKAVIPERADQIGYRKRRGSQGGRPVGLDTELYKQRNVVERAFNRLKQWRLRHPSPRARRDLPRRGRLRVSLALA